ncbi:MAG: hypothetical protein CL856_05950 [Cryomorphaceae bacterium]|nr:hypothetical protein [Cryomorphaceae bacterium]|tara:strand:- start:3855 stop:5573 length:1719 start_codon:yes stop_codon:yes gene_type:complete
MMKRYIYIISIIYAFNIQAQSVSNGVDITVKDKFEAKVAEAIKITGQPNYRDSTIEKLPVEINLRSRNYTVSPLMKVIPAIKILRTKVNRLPGNTIYLSAGNYFTTSAGFSFGNSRSPIQTWSLQGRHLSSFGGFKVSDATGSRKSVFKNSSWLENVLRGHYNRVLKRGRLLTKASANHDRYSFYGQPYISGMNDDDTLRNAPSRWIRDYQAEIKYEHSGYKRKQVFQSAYVRTHRWIDQGGRQLETGLSSGVNWRLPIEDLFLELPLKGSVNRLSGSSRVNSLGEAVIEDYWTAQFSPAITDSLGSLSFKVGINLIFDGVIGTGIDTLRPYVPPVFHVEFPLVKNVLNVFGGIEGGVENDGMRSRVKETPFLAENAKYEIVRSSSIYGGISGRLSSAIGYRFGARQRNYENYAMVIRGPDYLYANGIDSGRLSLEYVELNYFEPSGELTFQSGLGLELRGFALFRVGINNPNKPIYHIPSSQIGGQVLYNLKGKIRFESTIIRHGERNARLGWAQLDLAPYWDGRMSIVYTYNDQLNATFRIDNIFNSRVDWWTGYTAQGIRANLGLVYKF